MKKNSSLRIAAVGDIHVGKAGYGPYSDLFTQISQNADVLLLCGDLTGRGYIEEAEKLAEELRQVTIPVLGVLGNHEYEHNHQEAIKEILKKAKMRFLDEEPYIQDGVGFAGVKGFGGGFGSYMLTAFGEQAIKDFTKESSNEALRLENLLSELETDKKVVALHYSPIKETVVNEPEEIYPFLGSSHLMQALDNYNVTCCFHGHAHHGTHEGKTLKNIPVYNVAYPLMQKIHQTKPYGLLTL